MLLIGALIFSACTGQDDTADEDVADARATASAAIAERDTANERADAAEKMAAETSELERGRLARVKERGNVVCATGNDTPGFH